MDFIDLEMRTQEYDERVNIPMVGGGDDKLQMRDNEKDQMRGIDRINDDTVVDTVQLRDLIRQEERKRGEGMVGGAVDGAVGGAVDGAVGGAPSVVDTVQLRDLLQNERNQMRGGGMVGPSVVDTVQLRDLLQNQMQGGSAGEPASNRKTDNERWVDRVNMFGGNVDSIVSLEPPRLKSQTGKSNELVRDIVHDVLRGSDQKGGGEHIGGGRLGGEHTIDSYAVQGIREVNSLRRFFK